MSDWEQRLTGWSVVRIHSPRPTLSLSDSENNRDPEQPGSVDWKLFQPIISDSLSSSSGGL
jgi:hypothetical protein